MALMFTTSQAWVLSRSRRFGLRFRQLAAIGAAVGGGGASPALKFNLAANSQYLPIVAF